MMLGYSLEAAVTGPKPSKHQFKYSRIFKLNQVLSAMNNKFKNLPLLLTAIIFGAAVLIFIYNFLGGKNLAAPPKFDLSAYDQLNWPTPDWLNSSSEPAAMKPAAENSAPAEEKKPLPGVYFQKYFLGASFLETEKNIRKVLKDFPLLKDAPLIDLVGKSCVIVQIAPEEREAARSSLLKNSTVKSFEAASSGAPNFDLCFAAPKYPAEIEVFLKKYPAVKFILPPTAEFVAMINTPEIDLVLRATLTRLAREYGDVATVVEE
jgi:hypothetical protein